MFQIFNYTGSAKHRPSASEKNKFYHYLNSTEFIEWEHQLGGEWQPVWEKQSPIRHHCAAVNLKNDLGYYQMKYKIIAIGFLIIAIGGVCLAIVIRMQKSTQLLENYKIRIMLAVEIIFVGIFCAVYFFINYKILQDYTL